MKNKIGILCIAGSDCSSGAGVQADLKTVSSLGGYCAVSITSITAQNKNKVYKILNLKSEIVIEQIKAVLDHLDIKAIKIGLVIDHLMSKKISEYLIKREIPVVLDPVFVSSSGFKFQNIKRYKISQSYLSNCSSLLTPNLYEAEVLSGMKITNSLVSLRKSLVKLNSKFNIPILIKGYCSNQNIVDLFYDGKILKKFSQKKINNLNFHGTGCALSSAISFYLGKGFNLVDSIKNARKYLKKILIRSISSGYKGYLDH